jgi:glutamine amidotransferase
MLKTNYGYDFAAGIEFGNILGVQFHPEKSHKFGMKIFENFIKYY